MQRANFLKWRVEQDERPALSVDAKNFSRRFRADEEVAGLVERERRHVGRLRPVERPAFAVGRDLVDDALLAGAGVDVAVRVDRESPDVFLVGVEERGRRSAPIDLVDSALRRRCDVEPAVRRRRERVHLELVAVEQQRPFSLRIDLVHLAFVARADKQRPIGSGRDRPQRGRRCFVHQLDGRPEHELAVTVDRQVLDIAFQEIGLGGRLKCFWRGRVDRRQRQREDRRRHSALAESGQVPGVSRGADP